MRGPASFIKIHYMGNNPFSIKPYDQYVWSVYTVVCITFFIFTLQRENRLQQAEDRLKELQEKVDSEFKNVFLQYDLELEKEKETSMKLEYELENQVCCLYKLWSNLGEKNGIIIIMSSNIMF